MVEEVLMYYDKVHLDYLIWKPAFAKKLRRGKENDRNKNRPEKM